MSDFRNPGGPARPASPGQVLLLCTGATFMAFLDLSVVNIAFPKIIEDFSDASLSTLTWVISGYAVLFAAILTPAGRLADSVGRTTVFLWSVLGFTLASMACGLATGPEWLIAARGVQGAFAAGMIPAALGLILTTTPPQQVTKAIGTWSAVAGFSAVIGPALGGVLVEGLSWRSVFYLNVPVGVLLLVAGFRHLPRQRAEAGKPLPDLVGTAALALGIGLVVTSLTESDSWGWSGARTPGLLVLGLVLMVLAALRSRRHPSPAIATELWRSRAYASVNLVSALMGIAMFAWLLAAAIFATEVWGWSIMQAAGAMSVGAFASMITAGAAGNVTRPTTQRTLVVVGALMFAACTAWMGSGLLTTDPAFWTVWVPTGLLGGGGLGFATTCLSSIAASSLPPTHFAVGVGMNLTARQIGGGIGTAMLAAILAASHATPLDAFHDLYLACAGVSVAAAAVAVIGLRTKVLTVPEPAVSTSSPAPVTQG